jgi:hypothetical protein
MFEPINSEKQREAVAFLNQNAFQTPTNLIDPEHLSAPRAERRGGPHPEQPTKHSQHAHQ